MSMTSKTSAVLRGLIISLLASGFKRTNKNIGQYSSFSLRAIQEATQKMTKEGVIKSEKIKGQTFYSKVEQKLLLASNPVELGLAAKF